MYSVIRNKLISLDANEGEIVALSGADAKTSSVIEGSYNLEPNKYKSKYSRRTISLIFLSRSLRTTDTKLHLIKKELCDNYCRRKKRKHCLSANNR